MSVIFHCANHVLSENSEQYGVILLKHRKLHFVQSKKYSERPSCLQTAQKNSTSIHSIFCNFGVGKLCLCHSVLCNCSFFDVSGLIQIVEMTMKDLVWVLAYFHFSSETLLRTNIKEIIYFQLLFKHDWKDATQSSWAHILNISKLSEEKLKFYLSCLARNVLKLKKIEELAIFKSLSQQLGTMYVSETWSIL